MSSEPNIIEDIKAMMAYVPTIKAKPPLFAFEALRTIGIPPRMATMLSVSPRASMSLLGYHLIERVVHKSAVILERDDRRVAIVDDVAWHVENGWLTIDPPRVLPPTLDACTFKDSLL